MLENQLEVATKQMSRVQIQNTTLNEKLGNLQTSLGELQQYIKSIEHEKDVLLSKNKQFQNDKESQVAAVVDDLRAKLRKEEQLHVQLENENRLVKEKQQDLVWENDELKNMASRSQYFAEEHERENQELREALEKSNKLVETLSNELRGLQNQGFKPNQAPLPTVAYPHAEYAYFNEPAANEQWKDMPSQPFHSLERFPTLSQEDYRSLSQGGSDTLQFHHLSQESISMALDLSLSQRSMSQEYSGISRSQGDSCQFSPPQYVSFYSRSSSLGKIQTGNIIHEEKITVITADGMSDVHCKPVSTPQELHLAERVVVHRSSGNEYGIMRALYVKIDKKSSYVGVELDLPSLCWL